MTIGKTFEETVKNMRLFLGALSPKEREIIMLRHGFTNDGVCWTLEEVGKKIGVTRERVRQIEEKAYKRVDFTIQQPETAILTANEETPGTYARRFFAGDKELVARLIEEIMLKYHGSNKGQLEIQLRKFWLYWSEANKSGKKQRWELEKTFDVRRRIYTWLSRSISYDFAAKTGAGAGTTI